MTSDGQDNRPEQFKLREAELHAERERVRALSLDWAPSVTPDTRDMRDPSTVGREILRMKRLDRYSDDLADEVEDRQRLRDYIDAA